MNAATAIAFPNIAFIKYWGNRDPVLRLPSNGSISMNLDGLQTRTQVTFDPALPADRLTLNGRPVWGQPLERVHGLLERVRQMVGGRPQAGGRQQAGGHQQVDAGWFASVESENNFPAGTGIASSASAFAALALAACGAAGLELSQAELSRLARRSSGSACRSLPGGFVEWQAGEDDESSFAFTIAPPEHWALADCVAIVSRAHKATGSYEGHASADTSILQAARIADAPRRLALCRQAILQRDFQALAEIIELDSNLMHAVIMTSQPPLQYWLPATLAVMQAVTDWRKNGRSVCYTIDAGPNVHVICAREYAAQVASDLRQVPGVQQVLTAHPGGPARLVAPPE